MVVEKKIFTESMKPPFSTQDKSGVFSMLPPSGKHPNFRTRHPDSALRDRHSATSYGDFQVAKLNLKTSFFFFSPIIFCELSKSTDTMRWRPE